MEEEKINGIITKINEYLAILNSYYEKATNELNNYNYIKNILLNPQEKLKDLKKDNKKKFKDVNSLIKNFIIKYGIMSLVSLIIMLLFYLPYKLLFTKEILLVLTCFFGVLPASFIVLSTFLVVGSKIIEKKEDLKLYFKQKKIIKKYNLTDVNNLIIKLENEKENIGKEIHTYERQAYELKYALDTKEVSVSNIEFCLNDELHLSRRKEKNLI